VKKEDKKHPSGLNDGNNGKDNTLANQADTGEKYDLKRIGLLTPREYELFLLLIEGFTLKESAKQLSIKYSTANTHMTNIYKKLNVNSRSELIINYRNFSTNETRKTGC
jgi:DNA-binding CsgD family transcriptional regulator